jgi:hypothetical protein
VINRQNDQKEPDGALVKNIISKNYQTNYRRKNFASYLYKP